MIFASYDFSNDKARAKFSKFLSKFGRKLQYSVYEIKNSDRVLQNIKKEVELKYRKSFGNCDSILVIRLCERCKKNICRYGYAENDEKDVVIFE
jgi:CRISPR-associated protein Cas2